MTLKLKELAPISLAGAGAAKILKFGTGFGAWCGGPGAVPPQLKHLAPVLVAGAGAVLA